MPPAISDDEMDDVEDVEEEEESNDEGPDAIPARRVEKKTPAQDDDEEEEDEEGDDDEFQVEKILTHEYDKTGDILYRIKWLGYEEEGDLTWEPLSNLDGAKVVLDAYHKKIGEVPPAKYKPTPKKPGRTPRSIKRSNSEAFEEAAPVVKKKCKSSEMNGKGSVKSSEMPVGSWEEHIERVSAIVQETNPGLAKKDGQSNLMGLLEWKNGRKTQHTMEILRLKCPQRLLDYYENHLLITKL